MNYMNYTNVTVENCIELIEAEAKNLRENPDQITSHEIMAIRLGMLVRSINAIELSGMKIEIANLKSQIAALEE